MPTKNVSDIELLREELSACFEFLKQVLGRDNYSDNEIKEMQEKIHKEIKDLQENFSTYRNELINKWNTQEHKDDLDRKKLLDEKEKYENLLREKEEIQMVLHHIEILKKDLSEKEQQEKEEQRIKRDVINKKNETYDVIKKAHPVITKPVSLAAAIGKIGGEVSSVFMSFAKNFFSPIDYFIKGCLAIRDFVTTEKKTGQRKVKLGAALFVAAASFAYVGIATSLAVHALLGATITAGAAVVLPIAAPIIVVGIAAVGLIKESYVFHNMRLNIKKEEQTIAQKKKQLEICQSRVSHDAKKQAKNNLDIQILKTQIKRHENNIKKMTSSRSYQMRRVFSSTFTTAGYLLCAFGLIFPPLLVVGASMVLASAVFDACDKAYDRHKKKQELATQMSVSANFKKADAADNEKHEQENLRDTHSHDENTILINLAAHTSHAEHTKENVAHAVDYAQNMKSDEIEKPKIENPVIASHPTLVSNQNKQNEQNKQKEEDESEGESSSEPKGRKFSH